MRWLESLPPRKQARAFAALMVGLVIIGALVGDPAVIGDRLLD